MQTGPAGYAAALAARQPLTVSAPVTEAGVDLAAAWAETIEVRRELSGELPDSASTVVGGVSATLTARGDAYATGAPSPMRPADVREWLNAATSAAAGYAGLTVPVFTGRSASLDASEANGTLELVARDGAALLTEPVYLPAYGSTVKPYALGDITRYPTNTEGVVVNVLHRNGIRVTPAPRSGCVLSVPGVGGWLADTGWTFPTAGGASAAWLTSGRFGSAPNVAQNVVRGYLSGRVAYGVNYVMIEAFIRVGTPRTNVLSLTLPGGSVSIDVTATTLNVRAYAGAASALLVSSPIDAGWRHVCVEVRGNTYRAVWVDGAPVGSSTATWSVNPGTGWVSSASWIGVDVQAVAVHVSGSQNVAPSPTIATFSPEADVARGALDLLSVPDVAGRDSWDVLKEIAAAELGMVGFSESGRFFFKNRAELAANTIPVATWGIDLVDDLQPAVSVDAVITRATATVQRVPGIDSGRGAETENTTAVPALVADRVLTVPSGTSSVVLSGDRFLAEGQHVTVIASPGQAWDTAVGMALCTDSSGVTRYTGTDVSAWITPVSQTSVRLNFFNAGGFPVYVVWPRAWTKEGSAALQQVPFDFEGGGPAFWILGYRFTDEAGVEEVVDRSDAPGVATWGTRLKEFGESPWWQDAATVDAFLSSVVADTSTPRATMGDITVPADPRLQLGDAVKVEDVRGRVPGFIARITSIRLRLSLAVENGMTATYGLRQIVGSIPEVVTQPADQTATAGGSATFSALGTNVSSRQWQVDTGDGVPQDVAGATGGSYTASSVTAAQSGYRYRCRMRNASGEDFTRWASLTVSAPSGPTVTTHPSTAGGFRQVDIGQTVTLTAAATGSGAVTCQWQRRVPSGTWANLPGATSASLVHAVTSANGYVGNPETRYVFRAVFTDSTGSTASNESGEWLVNEYEP
ncbi:hypothetical protein M3D75_11655 [Microbacterium enclense]|uniref:hypothetical protein n=1 Tax=Microbacterium enclense TaxID=993073 RepID=UPI0021A710A7|nr:hypothetical protein [Microbacterium enclense]MCT2086772.1 hypothetical protein [Microbacterium enclense]